MPHRGPRRNWRLEIAAYVAAALLVALALLLSRTTEEPSVPAPTPPPHQVEVSP
jgi:hypothetical protein